MCARAYNVRMHECEPTHAEGGENQMATMTPLDHAAELIKKLSEASWVDTAIEDDDRDEFSDLPSSSDGKVLRMFIARDGGGYFIDVRHLDADTAQGIVADMVQAAEHAAGWDPTP